MKNVCVVTGGGSGIGFATAKEVAKKGYYVIMEKMMKKVKCFQRKQEKVLHTVSVNILQSGLQSRTQHVSQQKMQEF
mgnify:CR=1 FL=1